MKVFIARYFALVSLQECRTVNLKLVQSDQSGAAGHVNRVLYRPVGASDWSSYEARHRASLPAVPSGHVTIDVHWRAPGNRWELRSARAVVHVSPSFIALRFSGSSRTLLDHLRLFYSTHQK